MKKKELTRFKQLLEDMKNDIMKNARKTLAEEAEIDVNDLPDENDLASSETIQSMIFRLRDREKFLLGKIHRALEKINEGTYGVCESCGDEIPPKRLEVRPVTEYCIQCKEDLEKEERSYV